MSTVDTVGVDTRVYRTSFDPEVQHPCEAIVEAVHTATGVSSTEFILANSIDPDALQQLYESPQSDSWMLTFEHADVEITLWATGRIHVEGPALITDCSPDHL